MQSELRDYFDRKLQEVLAELPPEVHRLLEVVPLIVDDSPSPRICRKLGVRAGDLCGLYTGVPRTRRPVDDTGIPTDVIHIFRLGITNMARRADGRIDDAELSRQIRLTILHEVGHHFGMDEDELEELGY